MNSKESILKKLRESGNEYVSGELLAQELHISRAAIWKAIDSLRSAGVEITSSTNLGYRLEKESNTLHKESILSLLPKEVDRKVTLHLYPTIDSTNQEAKRLLADKATNHTIVIAKEQNEGRGRLGRRFHSPPTSGLYLSYILKQAIPMSDALLVTSAVAVATARAIEEVVDTRIKIKWVNDLYKDGKKVAGILTEGVSNFESGKVESIIIGIGINLFPPKEGFPEDIRGIATTLLEKEEDIINKLSASLITHVMSMLENLHDSSIMEEYRARSFVLGSPITVIHLNTSYLADVIGIEDDGSLRIIDENGKEIILNSGEISIRKRV